MERAAVAADRAVAMAAELSWSGSTELEMARLLRLLLLETGHDEVTLVTVAAGEHSAAPYHRPAERVINPGDAVLVNIGGRHEGYCSDITRCVSLGEPPAEVAEAYAVLQEAQQAAVAAATVGTPCEEVDATARRIIAAAGFGDRFVHRTGHGIGIEEHEDPYVVAGNATPLVPGHAFSVEPGIYTPGRWGMRLEDIVVAATEGPDALNRADHRLVVQ